MFDELTLETRRETIAHAEDGRVDVALNVLEALDADGTVIARLRVEDDGETYGLWVAPEMRRRGIATRLWEVAPTALGIAPRHSAWRTDDGDAFARSFGVALPPREIA